MQVTSTQLNIKTKIDDCRELSRFFILLVSFYYLLLPVPLQTNSITLHLHYGFPLVATYWGTKNPDTLKGL